MNPIEDILEDLQRLFDNSKPIMFTEAIKVDRNDLEEIIYNLRTSIPECIKEAERVIESCDRYVDEANLKAERILSEATIEAQKRVSEHEVYIRAIDQAEKHVENVNSEIDAFCAETIKDIDGILADISQKVADFNNVFEKQQSETSRMLKEYIDEVYLMRKSLREEQ